MNKAILLGALVVLFLTGAGCGKVEPTTLNTVENQNSSTNASSPVPSELVGTWRSECLVPDLDSNYAEQHQFIINADGTAEHNRWIYGNQTCLGSVNKDIDLYTFRFPGDNRINQLSGGQETFFDIYSLNGGTLLFGHGFRNNLPYTDGTLNEYIRYTKSSTTLN